MSKAKWRTVRIVGLGLVVIGLLAGIKSTGALTLEELVLYSQNNIVFTKPCKTGSSGSADCGITVSGSTIEEKIWNGLTQFMTDEQAAGVMGNMAHEGGFNPARHETAFLNSSPNFAITTNTKNSYGIGLIQWSFGRRVNLLNLIKEKASDLLEKYIDKGRSEYGYLSGSDFLTKAGDADTNTLVALELCYLKQEFEKNPVYAEVLNKNTVQEAADYFLEKIEVPADIEGTRSVRRADAEKYYNKFHGKTISGTASDSGSGDPCNASIEGSKNINGAAVALAWPLGTSRSKYEWPNGTGTELFNEVYPKLLSKGARRSYKGCNGPVYGASCDRFVATVVRYSGYDKKFPTGVGLGEGLQGGYPLKHQDLWKRIPWDGDPEALQAGDIVLRSGHVAIAVQDEDGKFYIAEAGLCNSYGHIRKIRKKENFDYIIRATNAKNSTVGVSVTDGVKTSSTNGTLTTGTGRGNGDINASAIALAWPEGEGSPTKTATDKFKEVFASLKGGSGSSCWKDGKSCSVFVNTVLLYAGAQTGEKVKCPGCIADDMIESDDWEEVGNESNLKNKDLKGGDVIVYYNKGSNPGNESKYDYKGLHVAHIAIYVETSDGGRIAEASYCSHFGKINKLNLNSDISRGYAGARAFRWKKQNSGVDCDVCGDAGSDGDMQLKAGGMTLAEAKEFMKYYSEAAMGKYYKKTGDIRFGSNNALVHDAGCPYGVMNNCVAFSQWFINQYTTVGPSWNSTTNGVGLVKSLARTAGLKTGSSPRPYAIFSNAQWSYAGHTGVVLGVDENAKKIVVGEASCSAGVGGLYYKPQAAEYSFDYVKKHNWTFAYTDDVISMGGQLKDV